MLHGDKRGKGLGFPTANLALDGLHLPKLGVVQKVVAAPPMNPGPTPKPSSPSENQLELQ